MSGLRCCSLVYWYLVHGTYVRLALTLEMDPKRLPHVPAARGGPVHAWHRMTSSRPPGCWRECFRLGPPQRDDRLLDDVTNLGQDSTMSQSFQSFETSASFLLTPPTGREALGGILLCRTATGGVFSPMMSVCIAVVNTFSSIYAYLPTPNKRNSITHGAPE